MLNINIKYNRYLAQFFSSSVITELVQKKPSPFFDEIILNSGLLKSISGEITYGDIFELVYEHLSKTYRNEYVYKNAIANKILLVRHSLRTSFMLTEFRVSNCKADAVVLNGTSHVYEIKSELDSLDRLNSQICAYKKAFDNVHIIAAPVQIKKIRECVGDNVGLMQLGENGTIQTIREAVSGKDNVDQGVIFDSLRKSEYQDILLDKFGLFPIVPNTESYDVHKKLFCELKPAEAHDYMVKALKNRGNCSLLQGFILKAPMQFKALALNSGLRKTDFAPFFAMLNSNYEYSY